MHGIENKPRMSQSELNVCIWTSTSVFAWLHQSIAWYMYAYDIQIRFKGTQRNCLMHEMKDTVFEKKRAITTSVYIVLCSSKGVILNKKQVISFPETFK